MNLRPLEPSDLDALYLIENESADWQYSRTSVPYSRSVLKEYIENQRADIYLDGQVRLVIEEDGFAVGFVDLVNFDPRDLRAEVSIIINKEYRGRGLAHKALLQLIEYSRMFLMMEHLYAIIDERNEASAALFAKAGFVKTVELKDWFRTNSGRVNAHIFQLFLKKE